MGLSGYKEAVLEGLRLEGSGNSEWDLGVHARSRGTNTHGTLAGRQVEAVPFAQL